MPLQIDLTLQDLAKIALGSPQLTNVHISVLHSLIDILLKKLNCQNETVALNAIETKYLEKILESSKISPLPFNDEQVEMVGEKLKRLDKLENEMKKLETKLECHLEETKRESNLRQTALDWENWNSYGTEDLCTICDPDNDVACKILKNTDFLKKLLRRISAPMVERMFYFEDKLKLLHQEFMLFTKSVEEELLKIQLLETCLSELQLLHKKIDDNHREFIDTMEEVQQMLDSKMDKIHVPAFKKYITDHFQYIEQEIQKLQSAKECPKAAGIIMDGVRCMSCGSNHVCSEVGVQPTAILPDIGAKESRKMKKNCGGQQNLKVPANHKNSKFFFDKPRPNNIRQQNTGCKKAGDNFELMEGFDGNLYRKG